MATVTTSIGVGTSHDENVNITAVSGAGPYTVTLAAVNGSVNGDALWDEHATPRKYLITAGGGTTSLTVRDSEGVGSAPNDSGTSTAQIKRYYSSLGAWESDLDDTNVYSSSDDAVGEAYDDANFNESVSVNGGGTVGLSTRTMTVASGERHSGIGDGSGVAIVRTASGMVFESQIDNTTFEWFEVDGNGGQYVFIGNYNALTIYDFRWIIIHDTTRTSNMRPVALGTKSGSAGPNVFVENCILYDVNQNGGGNSLIEGFWTDDPVTEGVSITNCTLHDLVNNSSSGINHGIKLTDGASSVHVVRNNIVTSVTGSTSGNKSCYSPSSPTSGTWTHNLSSDATASGTGSLTNKAASDQFVSTTGGSEDLHLKTGADAIDAGVDLGSGDKAIDIDGRNRDTAGDTWDMGADEFVPSGIDITPPQGNLTLSTVAPSDPTVQHLRNPAQATLLLSTVAPADPMVDHARVPGVVDLTLTTTAPTRLYAHQRDTGAGDLVLSTTAPSLGAGVTITPAAANLTLSTTAPVDPMVDHARIPATVNLTLTTTAPSDQMVAHLRGPAAADLTLSSVAPTRLYAHQRDTTTGNLTLTTTAPTLGTSISIIPDSANLTLSTVAPTKALDHNRAGAAGDLALSSVAPARVNASHRTTTTGNLTLTTTAPSDPVLDHTRTPTAADLTLSTTAPTRLFEHLRTVTAGNLTLTTTAPTRQLGVVTALGVMTWSVSYDSRTWGVVFGNRTFDVPYDELGD